MCHSERQRGTWRSGRTAARCRATLPPRPLAHARGDRVARALLIVVLAALACARPQPPQTPATTIIVVRHAEKKSGGTDPDLNLAGAARAQALAAALANAHVASVYVTQYRRTSETAQPLVGATHAAVLQIGIDLGRPGDYPQRLAKTIRARDAGRTVLVVTHSNAIADVVRELAGVAVSSPQDQEYDRLYVITIRGGAPPTLVEARYGAPFAAALPASHPDDHAH